MAGNPDAEHERQARRPVRRRRRSPVSRSGGLPSVQPIFASRRSGYSRSDRTDRDASDRLRRRSSMRNLYWPRPLLQFLTVSCSRSLRHLHVLDREFGISPAGQVRAIVPLSETHMALVSLLGNSQFAIDRLLISNVILFESVFGMLPLAQVISSLDAKAGHAELDAVRRLRIIPDVNEDRSSCVTHVISPVDQIDRRKPIWRSFALNELPGAACRAAAG